MKQEKTGKQRKLLLFPGIFMGFIRKGEQKKYKKSWVFYEKEHCMQV